MLELSLILESETATEAFGAALAAAAEPGLIVGLVGGLGAGKTHLVRSTAVALGASESAIHSPTFMLIQCYPARIPLYHFDTYRLRDADEFLDLGPEEYFQPDSIGFVEWADRVSDVLPEDLLWIELTAVGANRRRAAISAEGAIARRVLERLVEAEEAA